MRLATPTTRPILVPALCAAALLAGCRSSPPSTYFVLTPLEAESRPDSAADTTGLVAVLLAHFPAYLERVQLVRLERSGALEVSPSQAWAEPLERGFARVLAEDLALLLQRPVVVAGSLSRPPRAQLQVEVDVTRFDVTARRSVQLVSTWLVEQQGGDEPTPRRTVIELEIEGQGPAAEVAARSAAVAELARRIAAALGTPRLEP